VGSHEHTHFEFKIGRKHADAPLAGSNDPASIACPIDFEDQSPEAQENPEILHLDPWIVFWQTFEDRKARRGDLQASIAPLAPAKIDEPTRFAAQVSGPSATDGSYVCVWTFGDGGTGEGTTPQYVYARAGVYPVTLVVQDGDRRVTRTHHLVVHAPGASSKMGQAPDVHVPEPVPFSKMVPKMGQAPGIHALEPDPFSATATKMGQAPAIHVPEPEPKMGQAPGIHALEPVPFSLEAPDEPSFRLRPAAAVDVYGWPVKLLPHTLQFVARASRPVPSVRTISVRNPAGGALGPLTVSVVGGAERAAWLQIAADDDAKQLRVAVDATGLAAGTSSATVHVACDGAVNSPQSFRVVLEVRDEPPGDSVTIDDSDAGFYATPYFWVGHRFSRVPVARRGYKGFYLTNGGVAAAGEFVRCTPDLQRGVYAVSLHEATPFGKEVEFDVRVRHRGGTEVVRVRPSRSREIGVFEFDEGTDGYVEILAEGSNGLVVADAVVFRRSAALH
jgi:hypothetical protein